MYYLHIFPKTDTVVIGGGIRMNKKVILSLLLGGTLVLGACGGADTEEDADPLEEEPMETEVEDEEADEDVSLTTEEEDMDTLDVTDEHALSEHIEDYLSEEDTLNEATFADGEITVDVELAEDANFEEFYTVLSESLLESEDWETLTVTDATSEETKTSIREEVENEEDVKDADAADNTGVEDEETDEEIEQ